MYKSTSRPPRLGFAARYTLIFAIVNGLLCALVAGSYYTLRVWGLDESLHTTVNRIAHGMDEVERIEPSAECARAAERHLNDPTVKGVYCQIHTEDGRILARSSSLGEHALPLPVEAIGSRAIASEPRTIRGEIAERIGGPGASLRVLPRRVLHQSGPAYWVVAAGDWGRAEGAFHSLLWILAIGFFLSLTAIAVTLWIMVRRAVAPVRGVLEQAKQIDPRKLSQRLDVPAGPEEVRRMVVTVNEMLDRIQAAFDAHTRFIGNVSHELKTPLTYLLSQTQLARRGSHSAEDFDRYLDNTESDLRRMKETVEGLLTLARASAGQEELATSRIPVNDVVLDAVEHCQRLARHREVRIHPTLLAADDRGTTPVLEGDHDLLSVMLENVLRNAIQHSPIEGVVRVWLETENDQATIALRDQGTGIAPDAMPRLFDAYYQAHPGEQQRGLSRQIGLGLAISRAIAQMHGGDVSAVNHPDGGALFRLRLPLAPADGPRRD